MERVVDAIQQNLPVQMSLTHWKVGPMTMGSSFEDDIAATTAQDNGVKAQTMASTFDSTVQYDDFGAATKQRQANFSGTQYDLDDDDMAMAAAAAAAAVARMSNHPKKHQPNIRKVRENIKEAFQSVRDYSQSEKPRELARNVRQQLQTHSQKTPQLVTKVVKNVRNHVQVRLETHGWPLERDDYTNDQNQNGSEQEEPVSEYCDSLNESSNYSPQQHQQQQYYHNSDEAREQPPSPRLPTSAADACEQVWHQLQTKRSQLGHQIQHSPFLQKLPSQMRTPIQKAAASAAASRAESSSADECYVSFSDGNAKDAIEGFTTANPHSTSTQQQQHQPQYADMPEAAYADMQEPPTHQRPLHQSMESHKPPHSQSFSTPVKSKRQDDERHVATGMHSAASYHWGAPSPIPAIVVAPAAESISKGDADTEATEEEHGSVASADSSANHEEEETPNSPTTPVAMHSTARYQWSASTIKNSNDISKAVEKTTINDSTTTEPLVQESRSLEGSPEVREEQQREEQETDDTMADTESPLMAFDEDEQKQKQLESLEEQEDEDVTVDEDVSLMLFDEETALFVEGDERSTPTVNDEEKDEEHPAVLLDSVPELTDLLQLESASLSGNNSSSSTHSSPESLLPITDCSKDGEDEGAATDSVSAATPAPETLAMHSTAKFHWGASTCQPSAIVQ